MSCLVHPNTITQQQQQQPDCAADEESISSLKPDVAVEEEQQQEHSISNDNDDNNNNNKIHPSELSFGPITKENIDELRKINLASFPVKYNERFYKSIIDVNDCELNKFVYYKNHIVGALSCRYEIIISTKTKTNKSTTTASTKTTETIKNRSLSMSSEEDSLSTAAMTIDNTKRRRLTNVLSNSNDENIKNTNNNDKYVKINHSTQDQEHQQHNKEQLQIEGKRLYIMTLAVIAPFRGRGIGTYLFQSVLNHCQHYNDSLRQQQQQHVSIDNNRELTMEGSNNNNQNANTTTATTNSLLIQQVLLHVQTSNIDAINFYINHFDFKRGELVHNYYRRIDPPHCYVLYKNIFCTSTSTNTGGYDDTNKEN